MGSWNIPNTPGPGYIEIGQCPRFYSQEITTKLLPGGAIRLFYEQQNGALIFSKRQLSQIRRRNGYQRAY